MARPTEIIVYSNPLEKAMWDMLDTPAGNNAVMGFCALALTVIFGYMVWTMILQRPINRLLWKRRQRKGQGGVNYYSRTRF